MGNCEEQDKDSSKCDRMMIIFLIILFLFLVFLLSGWYGLDHMKTEVNNMKADIEYLKQQTPFSSTNKETDYLNAIEFMENETEKYREFVQQQQQFIISLLGVIGTGLAAITTFIGIKSKKDVSNIFHDEYAVQVDDKIAKFIGGHDQVQYLEESIQKEKTARDKKILFLLQDNPDKNLKRICNSLCDQGYKAEERIICGSLCDARISSIIKGYNLVIYQVSKYEFLNGEYSESGCPGSGSDLNFRKIASECNRKKIFCVLYCTGRINTNLCDLSFYVNTANYGSTALERIYNVLYYIQE